MSKKMLKRSLALGALMAFVITGSAMAADLDKQGETLTIRDQIKSDSSLHGGGVTTHGTQYHNETILLNDANNSISNATFSGYKSENTVGECYGGVIYNGDDKTLTLTNVNFKDNTLTSVSYTGNKALKAHGGAVANSGMLTIVGGEFSGNSAYHIDQEGLDQYGSAIFNSGTLIMEGVTVKDSDGGRAVYNSQGSATFIDNIFENNARGAVQTESAASAVFEGSNTFEKNGSNAINNKGTSTFKEESVTTFIDNEVDINNDTGSKGTNIATVNVLKDATVILGTGMAGSGTVNVAGTLKGRVFVLEEDAARGANSIVLNEGGTWIVAGESVVSGISVNGNATIDGEEDSSLTLNKTITAKGQYAITHNGGELTIKNLTVENMKKEYSNGTALDETVYGSVLYSANGGKINIEDSTFQNNTNTGSEKNYAVVHVTTDMDIINSHFINNSASYMGGALKLHQNGNKDVEYNITETEFKGNKAAQGGAIQANGGTVINFYGENSFTENEVTKSSGDCGGAICAEGTNITFYGNTTFDGNKALNGNGGAIAQYYNSTKIVFDKDSYTKFTNNTANGNGGAIWNGTDAIIEVNGDLLFEDNTAGNKGNDIYNLSALKFLGGNTKVSGGIVSEGADAFVEISNDATLELAGGTTSLNVLKGEGGIIRFLNADAELEVVENNNTGLKFTATSEVNSAVGGDANKLISNVDWNEDTTMVLEAGDVVGEVTAELGEGEDGKLVVKSQSEKVNTKNQAIGEAAISMKLHWRSHMNDMNKRMGELRNANGEHGVWTRMVRGENEYEGTKAQYNQYQLGYDEKLSVDKRWTVGAAVTFAEGDANYGNGSTDDKSTAFAIYGSKLNNDGTFVDLIARYARIESDFEDASNGKGDYSTNGMSVSAEFGKRIQQGNGLWIEPQVELTYGNIDSAEFQLGGKTVQVGDMDSLIGRVGFSLGKDIKQGNVYARASYLYDFDGETESAFSASGVTRTIEEDLGGGWWEVGVGANINLSKATYIYADIEKTFGGEVDTNWQWNLGVRYSF